MSVTSWKKIEIRFGFYFFSKKGNWNWHMKVMLVEIFTMIIVIVCFILYELASMSFLGWHPPHLMDNTDTLYLGDLH